MKHATFDEITAAVDVAHVLATRAPGCALADAVDVACDAVGVPADRDRRIARRLLERRLTHLAEMPQVAA
jgi:hypothetical protein